MVQSQQRERYFLFGGNMKSAIMVILSLCFWTAKSNAQECILTEYITSNYSFAVERSVLATEELEAIVKLQDRAIYPNINVRNNGGIVLIFLKSIYDGSRLSSNSERHVGVKGVLDSLQQRGLIEYKENENIKTNLPATRKLCPNL